MIGKNGRKLRECVRECECNGGDGNLTYCVSRG